MASPKCVIHESKRTGEIDVHLTPVRYIFWQLLSFGGHMKYTRSDDLSYDRIRTLGNRLLGAPVDTMRKSGLTSRCPPTSVARNFGDREIDCVSDFHGELRPNV
jgi:hypothetical protein